jgi:hypothetical protein
MVSKCLLKGRNGRAEVSYLQSRLALYPFEHGSRFPACEAFYGWRRLSSQLQIATDERHKIVDLTYTIGRHTTKYLHSKKRFAGSLDGKYLSQGGHRTKALSPRTGHRRTEIWWSRPLAGSLSGSSGNVSDRNGLLSRVRLRDGRVFRTIPFTVCILPR